MHGRGYPFPDGGRHRLRIERVWPAGEEGVAWASIVKDAGDDPDVTHGIEYRVRVALVRAAQDHDKPPGAKEASILIRGGTGVGTVTRPGLSVRMGDAAINPGPRRMINEAIREAFSQAAAHHREALSAGASFPRSRSWSRCPRERSARKRP